MLEVSSEYTIGEARLRTQRLLPYLIRYIMSLFPVREPGLGTMAIDKHGRMYYDPAVLERWSINESASVVLHECLHLVLRHCERAKAVIGQSPQPQDRLRWNLAVDFVVNAIIKEVDKAELPIGSVYAKTFGLPEGLSAEEYYHLLEGRMEAEPILVRRDGDVSKPGKNPGTGNGQDDDDQPSVRGWYVTAKDKNGEVKAHEVVIEGGSAADGIGRDYEQGPPTEQNPGLGEYDRKMLEREVAKEYRDQKNKFRGTAAGYMERFVAEILEPSVNPAAELRSVVKYSVTVSRGFGDYTYKRPSRRKPAGSRIVLPSHVRPTPRICLISDTSGSMDADDLGLCLGVIRDVLRTFPRENVICVSGDVSSACVQQHVNSAEHVKLCGGGGTDMGAIIVAESLREPRPDVIICITDGETPWPKKSTRCRVIAAVTQESKNYPVPSWITKIVIQPKRETART